MLIKIVLKQKQMRIDPVATVDSIQLQRMYIHTCTGKKCPKYEVLIASAPLLFISVMSGFALHELIYSFLYFNK